MLDIKFLRDNTELVRRKMLERGQEIDLGQFVRLDQKRRDILQEVEGLRGERNRVSKEIGKRKGQKQDASDLIEQMGAGIFPDKGTGRGAQGRPKTNFTNFVMVIPNIPHESVVYGTGSEDNPVVRMWGEKPQFDFVPKPHWEIGEDLGILDFARGAKITGARFTVYKGAGAKLERAITNFMLDLHTSQHGYTEVLTPFMVNATSMTGTGQLPKFAEDLFKIEGLDYYMIPTAEVPVTNIHAG